MTGPIVLDWESKNLEMSPVDHRNTEKHSTYFRSSSFGNFEVRATSSLDLKACKGDED